MTTTPDPIEEAVCMMARLRRHDRSEDRLIPVPPGQSLGFDENGATRRWLAPYLGTEWHLIGFEPAKEAGDDSRPD